MLYGRVSLSPGRGHFRVSNPLKRLFKYWTCLTLHKSILVTSRAASGIISVMSRSYRCDRHGITGSPRRCCRQ